MIRLSPYVLFSKLDLISLLIVKSSDNKDSLRVFIHPKDPVTINVKVELEAVPLTIKHICAFPFFKVHLDLKITGFCPCPWDTPFAFYDLVAYNSTILDCMLPIILLNEFNCSFSVEHPVDAKLTDFITTSSKDLTVKTDLHIVKLDRIVLTHLFKVACPEHLFSCHFFVWFPEHFN